MLACEASNGGTNSLDEMKGLAKFLNEHPGVTGVILSNLENDVMKNLLLMFELTKASLNIFPLRYLSRDTSKYILYS